MLRLLKIVGLFTLFMSINTNVFAEEECITVDMSGWTQIQKNLAQASIYDIVFKAGHNFVPKVNRKTGEVCFENPDFNLSSLVQRVQIRDNAQKILDDAETANVANQARVAALKISARAKLKAGSPLTDEEIDEFFPNLRE